MTESSARRVSLRPWLIGGAALLAAAVALWVWLPQQALAERLVRADAAVLLKDHELVAFAVKRAEPLYQQQCASCHGTHREGSASRGVPSLSDASWLYANNLVDLEQIVLYGIRSGHPKARNLTDMPAMGRSGQLSADDVEDAVQYLLQISRRPADALRAARGKNIYASKGNCFDCHATLYRSIYDGRHGVCPFRSRTLSALQARALAVSLRAGVQLRE
jgi:cytochrome c oxidase cbb3-type subunit 3